MPEDASKPTVRTETVGGLTTRVVVSGDLSANEPPLVLINGVGARLESMEALIAAMPNRPVVTFDLPGISEMTAAHWPARMPGMAEWVIELLDRVAVTSFDLLGYSWGGALAQQIAHDFPSRVRGLILAATNYGLGSLPLAPAPMARLLMNPASEGGPWQFAATLFGRVSHPTHGAHWAAPTLNGYFRQLYAFAGWTSLPWLKTIEANTLVIAGDEDPLVPVATARHLAHAVRRGELRVVDGVGHQFLTEHPVAAAGIITDFLERLRAAESPQFRRGSSVTPLRTANRRSAGMFRAG